MDIYLQIDQIQLTHKKGISTKEQKYKVDKCSKRKKRQMNNIGKCTKHTHIPNLPGIQVEPDPRRSLINSRVFP